MDVGDLVSELREVRRESSGIRQELQNLDEKRKNSNIIVAGVAVMLVLSMTLMYITLRTQARLEDRVNRATGAYSALELFEREKQQLKDEAAAQAVEQFKSEIKANPSVLLEALGTTTTTTLPSSTTVSTIAPEVASPPTTRPPRATPLPPTTVPEQPPPPTTTPPATVPLPTPVPVPDPTPPLVDLPDVCLVNCPPPPVPEPTPAPDATPPPRQAGLLTEVVDTTTGLIGL